MILQCGVSKDKRLITSTARSTAQRSAGPIGGASFLQDMRSWIWMPTELVVEVSEDGSTFVEAGRAVHDIPDRLEGVVRRDLEIRLDGQLVRALRFHALSC